MKRSPARRARAERHGRRGEGLAAWYLRLTGWTILDRRIKTARGEVDLVARRGGTVAFVEVKWRQTATARDQAIDGWRLRRVVQAAEVLASRYARAGEDIRVDVILLAPWQWPRRIENASIG